MNGRPQALLISFIATSLFACVIDRTTKPATNQPNTSWQPTPYPAPQPTYAAPTPYTPPEPYTPPAPSVPTYTGGDAFARDFLAAHNTYRARHCAAPLVWSDELQRYAQRWATHLQSQGCGLTHSSGSYGENLAGGTASALSPQTVTAMWYDEVGMYAYGSGFSMSTGHFTQVVWRNTQRLGCAMASCGGNAVYVCSYDPPGNYAGDFPKNVVASCP